MSIEEKLANFADWIHNNWYEPYGDNCEWRKAVENEEYTLAIPEINTFTSEELARQYLNNEGEPI